MTSFFSGLRLEDRFVLLEKIGAGGMGVVWLALDERLQKNVAVKVLHANLLDDSTAAERLRLEARAASSIEHPSICKVLNVGEHEHVPFLVMEILSGKNLSELLSEVKVLTQLRAVEIMTKVLSGVGAAHRHGVVHRDLKAENVFVLDDGSIKLLDFGVARLINDQDRVRLTVTGALVGTPAYMSPEQARGAPSDERADLWSCGVLLYELICGALPYDAANFQAMIIAIATKSHSSVRQRRPGVDRGLASIIDRSLSRNLNSRFQTARDFLEALERWRRDNSNVPSDSSELVVSGASSRRSHPVLTVRATRDQLWVSKLVPLGIAALIVLAGSLLVKSATSVGGIDNHLRRVSSTTRDASTQAMSARDSSASTASSDRVLRAVVRSVVAPVAGPDVPEIARTARGGELRSPIDNSAFRRRVRGRRRDAGLGGGITPDPDF